MKRRACIIGALVLVNSLEAAMVAGWEVGGVDVDNGIGIVSNIPPYTFLATTNETQHVSARLTLGPGVTPSTTASKYGFKIPGDDATNSLAGAIASGHYMELALDVEEGFALSLVDIEVNGEGTSSACSNVVVKTSVDGFADEQDIATAFPANGTGGLDTDGSGFPGPIDLSGSQYQNLTGTILIRFYGWNSTSGLGSTRLRDLVGNDLVVNGSVAIAVSGPQLAMDYTNGTQQVSATFDTPPSQSYVLQYRAGLTDSNGWVNVSSPFTSDSSWPVGTTSNAGFYRAISE